jgi:uncharacterized membrane protein YfcA
VAIVSAAGEFVFLVVAGAAAGLVGTAGGITSLVSYPALLTTGLSPLAAGVANLVALVACWPGSVATSRTELRGAGRWLARSLPLAATSSAAGAVLLLSTPPGVFARVVPFLVALGSVALLVQPVLTARLRPAASRVSPWAFPLVALFSVYSGYFGAGAGVLLLASVLLLVDDRLPEANAKKNMLNGACTAASAAILVGIGSVAWAAVVPLAAGMFAGSTAGPVVARRLPAVVVRWAVAGLGLLLAARLAAGAY